MKATPVIPGKAYRVTGCGLDLVVLAPNPVRALAQTFKELHR